MKRLFGYFFLFLFTASPLHADLIVTSEWASVELSMAFEAYPAGKQPVDYDDLVFSDSYTGGIEFDRELRDEGIIDGFQYMGYAIAEGFKGKAPDISVNSPTDVPVFGTIQVSERGDFEAGEYTTSLIDAIIHFTVVGADANSRLVRWSDQRTLPASTFTYTLYDLTLGTSFVAPDFGGYVTKEDVALLNGHKYALVYHDFRDMDDGTNQFTFFTDTNVIYTTVPAPPGLLLFVSGLLGLGISRKRR